MSEGGSTPRRRFRLSGKDVYIYREVSSTNLVARSMAADGAHSDTVIMAAFQNAGVGRMQRPWVCPAGSGITMSMILNPDINLSSIPLLSLLCGAVVAETVRDLTGCPAGLKWPNDVLVDGKKICGILAQGGVRKNACSYVILGVGLNVNQSPDEFPPEFRDFSTSLRMELGERVSRIRALKRFFELWDMHYAEFSRSGSAYIRERWLENNVTLGHTVRLHGDAPDSPIQDGVAVDISERGGLMLRLPSGDIKEFLAEELSLGRSHYAPRKVERNTK
ncbi:MAG: biotin--[acetyl-CoA-carboxylase] ligase [Clostridiales Family XIII bacterium]|jgi:BirA family biotin operon repressor/biotin-[acetyl-CoA-carboxylase] ligase|nr:biotin--[acetyl-CoA-carboxylase] ligase [Clostridiales Family XIII bacterium]